MFTEIVILCGTNMMPNGGESNQFTLFLLDFVALLFLPFEKTHR